MDGIDQFAPFLDVPKSPGWIHVERPHLGLINLISAKIASVNCVSNDCGTRDGQHLLLFSDFAGHHHESQFESYSYLVTSERYIWIFENARKRIRASVFRDNRRLSFKRLKERQIKRAIVPFLRAANTIPGVLVTVLVDKQIGSLFKPFHTDSAHSETLDLINSWKPATLERFLRVTHFASLIVASLSAPGQNLFWLTDNDEIVPNKQRLVNATRLAGNVMSNYLTHQMGRFKFGTTNCDDGGRSVEDFVALTDIAAGATAELASTFRGPLIDRLIIPTFGSVQTKTQFVLGWLSTTQEPLKKVTISIFKTAEGKLRVQSLELSGEAYPDYLSSRHEIANAFSSGLLVPTSAGMKLLDERFPEGTVLGHKSTEISDG